MGRFLVGGFGVGADDQDGHFAGRGVEVGDLGEGLGEAEEVVAEGWGVEMDGEGADEAAVGELVDEAGG